MLKSEAYKVLGISEAASKDEAKKAFKTLAKIHHPDINKAEGAEEKFKEINQAWQAIDNDEFDDNKNIFEGAWGAGIPGGFNWSDLFGGHGFNRGRKHKRSYSATDIHLNTTISFRESVLGINKDITYDCSIACEKCSGEGDKFMDNGCAKCKGSGRVAQRKGNMIFAQTCSDCNGKQKWEECEPCKGKGSVVSSRTISVSIKSGITSDTILRLMGVGNFTYPHYTNVMLKVNVTPIEGLRLEGDDVVSQVSIPLLDALIGCEREVPTIDGLQTIKIPAAIKNLEEVIIPKMGAANTGNQRVIIGVEYPEKLDKLVDILKTEV